MYLINQSVHVDIATIIQRILTNQEQMRCFFFSLKYGINIKKNKAFGRIVENVVATFGGKSNSIFNVSQDQATHVTTQ